MEPLSLSSEGCFPPLLERGGAVVLVNGFVKTSRKAFGEMSDGKGIVDVEMGVANKFFELHDIAVRVLGIHLESLHDTGLSLFFLQDVGVLSTEGYDGAVVQPWIPRIYSFLVDLALKPLAHGLNPFGHIVPLNVHEEE